MTLEKSTEATPREVKVKETGIIMSGDHPKLILDRTKTMTRRVVKNPRRKPASNRISSLSTHGRVYSMGDIQRELELAKHTKPNFRCPYGQVGDRLWVRETWAVHSAYDLIKPSELRRMAPQISAYWKTDPLSPLIGRWRPSIHMPRWASRITLEITELRVERLQEISGLDCIREGLLTEEYQTAEEIKDKFKQLWNSLNAKRGYGWDTNCWVWVIGFKQVV